MSISIFSHKGTKEFLQKHTSLCPLCLCERKRLELLQSFPVELLTASHRWRTMVLVDF